MTDTRNDQPSLALTELVPLNGASPSHGAADGDPGGIPLGSLLTFAGNFSIDSAPLADGETLQISTYPELFSLLGVNFGGDGRSNFGLPDLSGVTIVGAGTAHFIGDAFGTDAVTPTTANLPVSFGGGGQPLDNDQPSLGVEYIINAGGNGTGDDLPGAIVPFLGNFAPGGYLVADGQTLNIADFPALYAVIGNTYGGDAGAGTFKLPDLDGRTVVGASASLPLGTETGSDSATVTPADLPSPLGTDQAIDNGEPALALNYIVSTEGVVPDRSGSGGADAGTDYLGEILAYAGATAPAGWALADGAALSINATNAALFSVLGTNFGGDGRTTFDLPDLQDRIVVGTGTSGGEAGTTAGAATFKLATADLADTPTFTVAASTAASEQTPVVLDPVAALADSLLDAAGAGSGDYAGASLGVTDKAGTSADDQFSIESSPAFTIDGTSLKTTGGAVFATFSTANHQLAVTFGGGTATPTTALVNDVLDHIAYENLSDTPPATVGLTFAYQGVFGSTGATDTVTITPVDDAATITAAAQQAAQENIAVAFASAQGNAITITDPEGDGQTVTLGVTDGTLTLATTAGLSFAPGGGDGTGDQTMTFTASLAAVNAALDGLTYTPDHNFSGTDALTVATDDGHGGVSHSTMEVDVSGNPPTITVEGKLAIVTADYGSGDVSVLLDDGHGGFTQAPGSPVPTDGAHDVAIGDFNGDGLLDLVTADPQSHDVELFEGYGTGGFGYATTFRAGFGVGSYPSIIAVGDVDGDGHLDFAAADGHDVTVVYNALGGRNYTTVDFTNTVDQVALADVNGDGALDLVALTDQGLGSGGAVQIAFGHGDGTFGSAETVSSIEGRPTGLALVDMNGDGHRDIVASSAGDSTVTVLINNHDDPINPTFTAGTPVSITDRAGAGDAPSSVAVGDLDGKNGLDIVTGNKDGTVSVLLSDGFGGYQASTVPVGYDDRSVTLADVNGDGHLDIVAASYYDSTVDVLLNDGHGDFAPDPSPKLVGAKPSHVTTGTLDIAQTSVDGAPITFDAAHDNAITIGDPDGNAQTVTLGVNHGTLTLATTAGLSSASGDGTGAVTFSGSLDAINAALDGLVYTPGADANDSLGGDTLTITTNDGGLQAQSDVPITFAGPADQAPHIDIGPVDIAVGGYDGFGAGAVHIVAGDNQGQLYDIAGPATASLIKGVAIGDLDGDGTPDVATTERGGGGGAVEVFLGDGGTYSLSYSAGTAGYNPIAVAIGDVTGDGVPDIVTANYDGSVSILPFDAANGPQTPVNISLPRAYQPHAVAIGDINGDGRLDIVVGAESNYGGVGYATAPVYVLLQQANGSFDTNIVPTGNAFGEVLGLALGDLDGDGKVDIVTANGVYGSGGNSVTIAWNGPGHAATTLSTVDASGYGYDPVAVAVGDLNGDGKLDIVTADYGNGGGDQGDVTELLSDGHGGFTRVVHQLDYQPNSIALVDTDGDGDLDIVVGQDGSNTITVLTNQGGGIVGSQTVTQYGSYNTLAIAAGHFETAQSTLEDTPLVFDTAHYDAIVISDTDSADETVTLAAGHGTLTLATTAGLSFAAGSDGTADATMTFTGSLDAVNAALDGLVYTPDHDFDGHDTLTVTSDDGLRQTTSTAQITVTQPADQAPTVAIGSVDLVAASYSGDDANIFLGDSQGDFAAPTPSTVAIGSRPESVALADVNGDGNLDIVAAAFGANAVSVALGDGKGGFGTAVSYSVGTTPYALATGDLNGDGHADVVTADRGSNTVSVLLSQPNGHLSAGATLATGGTLPDAIALGDVNGDGNLDIVAADNGSAEVSVFLGDGQGDFGSATTFALSGTNPHAVVLADVNGDGKLDILTGNFTSNNVSVLLGDGAGGFAGPRTVTLPAGAATRSLAVGDVDGDGHPDLVVGNGSPDVVDVFHGNGRGAFTQSGTATVGTEADSLALADVNGDGILDLVAGNYQNSTISVALGNGDGTFVAAGPAMAVGALPVSLALGSLDTAQTTAEDTALVFGAAHGNAIIIGDGDGDTQTVTLRVGHGTLTLGDDTHVTISQGGEGQASLSISGTLAEVNEALDGLTYTPDANFNGSGADADKLTVTSDDRFEATSLSATITVTPVADAPTMSGPAGFSASWQHALDLTGQGLAVGDVDGSGDAETVTLTVGEGALAASAGNSGATVSGGGASLTISGTVAEIDALLGGAGTGTLTYLDDSATPAASTTLAVHVAGGDGFDGDGSFAIAIGVPTATAESYTLDEDTALTVPAASGVLANDHGPNGDALQAALLSGPAHGSVSLAADGSFVYTPDANFNGADSFVYQATDGAAASTPTTVGLTIAPVEDAPTAANDSAAVTEFHAVTGNVVTGAAGGSGGDSDVDGDSLAVIAVALAAGTAGHVGVALAGNYGTLTLAPDGSYSYLADPKAPVDAGTTVDDRFTYTVSDGHGGTATAELTIAVTGAASGTDGNDTISGGGGSDLLHGNPGDDTVSGGDSNDDIRGGSGNDTLLGNHGSDVLYGGAGDDVLLGRTGNDLLRGGSGNDHLNGGSGNDQLFGGAGDDHLTGMWGDDTMAGGAGNDRLVGDLGNDILTGGQGDDDLFGGAGRDTLSGGAGRDHLYGNAGNDTLLGGGDNDVLDGGLGRDTLTGGGGRDTFVFDTALRAHTPDTITDFVPWADRIELAHTVFSALPLARHLAATEFSGDGQAHTADQHILYDSHDGWLVYDANGSAPGGGTHFATLAHDLHITAADFLVVA